MMSRLIWVLAASAVLAAMAGFPQNARAALSPLDSPAPANAIEARQFSVRNQRVAGNESLRQNITAWRVTVGCWNGESLGGLSLVLVETACDNGVSAATTNCYVSHLATAAQRNALVSAFLAVKGLAPSAAASWRIEPSMITIEMNGESFVIHLGMIA